MRYAKKFVDPETSLDDDRVEPRLVRVRRREGPMSPRVTRKMAKIDAELLAIAAGADPRASMAPTAPPPAPLVTPQSATVKRAALKPPPLPVVFPFPFANAASPTTVTTTRDDCIDVRDSWLLPPPQEGTGRFRSLAPSEPTPFTLYPPTYSLVPR